jgi:hypothetical protein
MIWRETHSAQAIATVKTTKSEFILMPRRFLFNLEDRRAGPAHSAESAQQLETRTLS